MKNVLKLISLALVLGSGVIASASAAVIYDENISGDVSDSLPGTTLGALSLGTSTVIGNLPGNFDDDWFEFTIAAGLQLDGIIISAFTEVSGAGNGGNLGFSPGGLNAAGPFTAAQIGQDVLDITGPT
ncbi:MAG TPA: hypothetical protein VK642_15915, partial [Burkholderiales bacterium]|nr:hypothetical protein [Burkholderiales bacterium]